MVTIEWVDPKRRTMRSKTNMRVRDHLIKKGVYITELAQTIGISDSAMYTRMRREMPEEEQNELIALIDRIASDRQG